MLLALYIILSVSDRNALNGSRVITGASDMKLGLSIMIVIICMSMYYFALFIVVGG